MTLSPLGTEDFPLRQRERERESARERERARPRGRQRREAVEAKCAGSQASGSTYRMSVVSVRAQKDKRAPGRPERKQQKKKKRELPGKFPACCRQITAQEPTRNAKHRVVPFTRPHPRAAGASRRHVFG